MMRAGALLGFVGLVVSLLAACTSQPVQAPVFERAPSGAVAPPPPPVGARAGAYYTVQRGDTLISIALDHGLDYKDLAAWNNLNNPNVIRPGQQLRIKPPARTQEATVTVNPVTTSGRVEARPLGAAAGPGAVSAGPQAGTTAPEQTAAAAVGGIESEPIARKLPYSPENLALLQRSGAQTNPPRPTASVAGPPPVAPSPATTPASAPAPDAAAADDEDKVDWGWPALGKIIAGFSEPSNKGVDIAGNTGDPVIAAASGRVIYSGEMRGYGKLIVIKQNKTYSSVYAHNSVILVKEGQSVVKGQKIAAVGNTDSDRPELHFEIRKLGKPVDPAKYLPPT